MNLAQIKAWLARNKTGLGVAGAAGVGGLALLANRRKAGTQEIPSSPSAPAVRSPAAAGGPTYGYPVGYSGYDSSSSDVYNALQPQLESVGAAVDELRDLWENKSPIPVPGPAPAPPEPLIVTNRDWINQAVGEWVDMGRNAIDIQAALSQYTQGQPVNVAQTAGINWAVGRFGAAPEGVAGTSNVIPVS